MHTCSWAWNWNLGSHQPVFSVDTLGTWGIWALGTGGQGF